MQKKHTMAIAFSLVLLILVVGLDLVRPIILGKAVDEVIVDYNKVYLELETDSENTHSVDGRYYAVYEDVKEAVISDESKHSFGMIVYDETGYYFVHDLTYLEAFDLRENAHILVQSGKSMASKDDNNYKAVKMTEDEIKGLREPDFVNLIKLMLAFIILLVVGLTISYFQTILLHYTGQKIIYEIREEVFEHIQGMSVEFFNQNPVGKLVTRVTNDTETLNEMYTSVIVNSVKSALTLIGISIMMFVLNWRLSLVVFTVIPLVILATFLFRHFSRKAYRDVRTKVAAVNTYLSEHISGMKIVQIFTREKAKLASFDQINEGLLKAHFKQLLVFGIYRPSMYLIYIIGLALVLGYGGYQVINNLLTIGVLVIFLQYISNFF